MSIAAALGVQNETTPAMIEAGRRWPEWVARYPALAVAADVTDLPSLTRSSAADDVLRSLAQLASTEGDDEPLAATILSWLMLPGAVSIACSINDVDAHVDDLVASHLWTTTRTVDWTRPSSIAGQIIGRTRRAVQAEVGIGEGARRADPTWWRSVDIDPTTPTGATLLAGDGTLVEDALEAEDPIRELSNFLDAAEEAGALRPTERILLVELAVLAADLDTTQARISRGGLTCRAVVDEQARHAGRSRDSIEGVARRALRRLSAFADEQKNLAAA